MADAETAVLRELQSALFDPELLEAAIAVATQRLTAEAPHSSTAHSELRALAAEMDRLAEASPREGMFPRS